MKDSTVQEYTPDSWEIVQLTSEVNSEVHYRVLAGWSGGYAHGTNWKLSSGISQVIDDKDYWKVPQTSGSVYILRKNSERPSTATMGILGMLGRSDPNLVTKIVELRDIQKDFM